MNELMNFKTKADLWWQERRGLLKGIFKNPLFFALGVRIFQPDGQTVHLRLPWNKTQKLLAIVVILQLVILAGQWLEGPRMLPAAQAEPFNAGADRQTMIDSMKSIDSRPISLPVEIT